MLTKSSFSPEELFAENQIMVYYVIHKYFIICGDCYIGLAYDDFIQIGNMGLWKACVSYDAKKAKFSTYAHVCIYNEISVAIKRAARNKLLNNAISLHASISGDKKCELQDVIADPESGMLSSNSDISLFFNDFISSLSGREKAIVKLRILGYSRKSISPIIGLSQPHISRILLKIRGKYKEWE